MMTIRVRGPWTPSTRLSSMSLVALGPLMKVIGRTGSSTAKPSGTLFHDISDAHVHVAG